ncbi:MAG: HAMP domain-containing histidine kinase [Spirochaetales bacterium]|nr:HAMP domain-containing histidine kinase [Spirochaetales bacterium]
MKLQAKISLTLVVSMFIAAIISVTLINLAVILFDQSYSWYDLEKIALEVSHDLGNTAEMNREVAAEKLNRWKERYPNLDFSMFSDRREIVFTTRTGPRRHPDLSDIRSRIEEEEKAVINSQNSLRFIDTIDRSPFMVNKPVIAGGNFHGMVTVSVKKDFFLPFYIRINEEKITDSYIIIIATIVAVIALSFLLVFILTSPLIKRLRSLYTSINGFDLSIPGPGTHDKSNDEIGFLRNTFNSMAERIRKDYAERLQFFRERQEMLKSISHDFRTPLTSILGYAISLDEGVYDNEDEQRKYITIIRKKAEYMSRLFDEMMEFTRLDNDAYVLKRMEFNFAELIREIIIEYLPQFESAGFNIETEIPEIMNITGDKERLSRALRNLFDNVVTHAAEGRYIGVFLREDNGSKGIRIEIHDRGPGITEENLPKIFQRFHTGKGGGMGLGLAITREIIEKHGGRITVQNGNGRGAVFTALLPVRKEAAGD